MWYGILYETNRSLEIILISNLLQQEKQDWQANALVDLQNIYRTEIKNYV